MSIISALIIVLVIIVIAYYTGYLNYVLPVCIILPLALYHQDILFVGGGFDNLCRINENLYIGTDGKGTWYNMEKMTEHNKKFWYLLYSLMHIFTDGSSVQNVKDLAAMENNNEVREEAWKKMSNVYNLVKKSSQASLEDNAFSPSLGGLMAWGNFDYKKYDIWFSYVTPRKINWIGNRSDVDHHEIELVIPVKYKAGAPMTSHIGIQKSPYYTIISDCTQYQWNRYIMICNMIQNIIKGLLEASLTLRKKLQDIDALKYYKIEIKEYINNTVQNYNTNGYAGNLFDFLLKGLYERVDKLVKEISGFNDSEVKELLSKTLLIKSEKIQNVLRKSLELGDEDLNFLINIPEITNGPALMQHWNDQKKRLKEIEDLKKSEIEHLRNLEIINTNIIVCDLLLEKKTVSDTLVKIIKEEHDKLKEKEKILKSNKEEIKTKYSKMQERIDEFFKDYMEDIKKNSKYKEKMAEMLESEELGSSDYLVLLLTSSGKGKEIVNKDGYKSLVTDYRRLRSEDYKISTEIIVTDSKLSNHPYTFYEARDNTRMTVEETIFVKTIEKVRNENKDLWQTTNDLWQTTVKKKIKSAETINIILTWRIEKIQDLVLDFIYYPKHGQISIPAHSFAAKAMLDYYNNIPYMICAPTPVMRAIIRKAMINEGKRSQLYIGDQLTIDDNVLDDDKKIYGAPYKPAGQVVRGYTYVDKEDVDEKGMVIVDKNSPIVRTYVGTSKNIKILSTDRKNILFEYIEDGYRKITIIVNGERKDSEEYKWWYDQNIEYVEVYHDPFITIELDALASVLILAPCN